MAVLDVVKAGHPVLKQVAEPVEHVNKKLRALIDDMAETMYEADGVGLAAPQVGILQRIFVIDVYDDEGLRVFINPEILEVSGSQIGEEGCLSIPGESFEVERANYVKVKSFNEKGEEFILEATELLARAILHENDHLNGKLFIDYVK